MRIIDVFIAKNGEKLSDGTPHIRDECDNCYTLTPVPGNYFKGRRVERIARIVPDEVEASQNREGNRGQKASQ